MKFQGEPNQHVKVINPRINEPKTIRFDANGIYETHLRSMIVRMKRKYQTVEDGASPATAPEVSAPTPGYKCKKCDFIAENGGLLMSHYKKVHPKE